MFAVIHGVFLHAATVAFASELGDKTFFLVTIFVVWCPIRGVRNGPGTFFEQLFIAAGGLSALLTYVALNAIGFNMPSFVGVGMGSVTFILLIAFAIRAWTELLRADRCRHVRGYRSAKASTPAPMIPSTATSLPSPVPQTTFAASNEPRPSWISGGFLGDFKAYNPNESDASGDVKSSGDETNPFADAVEGQQVTTYGSSAVPKPSQHIGAMDPKECLQPAQTAGVLIATTIIAFLSILLAESSDKSLVVTRNLMANGNHLDVLLGLASGYLAAVVTAAVAGFILERTISERRVLVALVVGFCAMALVTASTVVLSAEGPQQLTDATVVGNVPVVNIAGQPAALAANSATQMHPAVSHKGIATPQRRYPHAERHHDRASSFVGTAAAVSLVKRGPHEKTFA